MQTVGERLEQVRRDQKLTQQRFSEELGISQSAYQNYERNGRDLPATLIVTLYERYSVDPIWILTGRGRKTDEERLSELEKIILKLSAWRSQKHLEFEPPKEAKVVLALYKYALKHGEISDDQFDTIFELTG